MTLEQLRVFVAVYNTRSLTAAAAILDMVPSSISRAISGLEGEIGVRLFQRTTRRVSPTQEGDHYFRTIAPLLDELDQAAESLKDKAAAPSGVLRIAVSNAFGELVLAPHLGEFMEQYPDIKIEMNLSDHRVDLVHERIDLAIRHGSLDDSSLIVRKLCSVQYKIVASPHYLETLEVINEPEDLMALRLFSFMVPGFDRQWALHKDDDQRLISVEPALLASSGATLYRTVCSGQGAAMLPNWMVDEDLEAGRLTQLLVDWKCTGAAEAGVINIVLPSRSYQPTKTRVFMAFIDRLIGRKSSQDSSS